MVALRIIMLSVLYGSLIFFLLFFIIVWATGGFFKSSGLCVNSWVRPYECGFSSKSVSLKCFRFTYFSLLVFFVVFDLEVSLLLKIPEQGIMFCKFVYYYFFLLVLVMGFVLEVLLGYVRWGY